MFSRTNRYSRLSQRKCWNIVESFSVCYKFKVCRVYSRCFQHSLLLVQTQFAASPLDPVKSFALLTSRRENRSTRYWERITEKEFLFGTRKLFFEACTDFTSYQKPSWKLLLLMSLFFIFFFFDSTQQFRKKLRKRIMTQEISMHQ